MKIEQLLTLLDEYGRKNFNNNHLCSFEIYVDGSGRVVNDDDTETEFDSVEELIQILMS
jgi:hypothetical protein